MERLVPDLLRRAAEMLGGYEALAKFLGAEEHAINFWLHARAKPPERVIFALVDLVLQDDIARAREDRRRTPRTTDRASA